MYEGNKCDVVIRSQVRLARNIDGFAFPAQIGDEDAARLQLKISEALLAVESESNYAFLAMQGLSDLQKHILLEKLLITPELKEGGEFSAVLVRRDEKVSVMIHETEHIRICASLRGFQLAEAAEATFQIEEAIGTRLPYAYDASLGFLTANLTEVGTGMSTLVLLHLPCLDQSQQIKPIAHEMLKRGVWVRPLNGDKASAYGNLFVASHQKTLGVSEQDILDTTITLLDSLIEQERAARERYIFSSQEQIEERTKRSLDVLLESASLSSREFGSRWSDVRLGIMAGQSNIPLEKLDALLRLTQPGHLQANVHDTLEFTEMDALRAKVVAKALHQPF